MPQTFLPVSYADVARAAQALTGFARRTPVLTSRQADERAGASVFFKCENFQRTGTFKFRGAYNAIAALDEDCRRRGVLAFSAGNHAQGVASTAALLNIPAMIIMPSDAPAVKLSATKTYGADVVLYDRKRESREAIAAQILQERETTLIPPFDHADIIAGQGTVAKELFEEVGPLDYLFVSIGGGGLISGSATAAAHLSPQCTVIGVEPEAGDDARQSLQVGEIIEISVPDTIADGARTQRLGKLTFPIIQAYVKDILTANDAQLREGIRFFAERMKIIIEPTGCLAAVPVLNRGIDLTGKRVGVILSGGNFDLQTLFA